MSSQLNRCLLLILHPLSFLLLTWPLIGKAQPEENCSYCPIGYENIVRINRLDLFKEKVSSPEISDYLPRVRGSRLTFSDIEENSYLKQVIFHSLVAEFYKQQYWHRYRIEERKRLIRKDGISANGFVLSEEALASYKQLFEIECDECDLFHDFDTLLSHLSDIDYIFSTTISTYSNAAYNKSIIDHFTLPLDEAVVTLNLDRYLANLNSENTIPHYAITHIQDALEGQIAIPKFMIFKLLSSALLRGGNFQRILDNRLKLASKLDKDMDAVSRSELRDSSIVFSDDFFFEAIRHSTYSKFITLPPLSENHVVESLAKIADVMEEIDEEFQNTKIKWVTPDETTGFMQLLTDNGDSIVINAQSRVFPLGNDINFIEYNTIMFNAISLYNDYLQRLNKNQAYCTIMNYKKPSRFKALGITNMSILKDILGKQSSLLFPNVICDR